MLPHVPKHYRPDIDGLRAIAVLSVLGFHAEIALLSAGYAGVDVFFVISGFLITAIILEALEKGTFSFREFYARRANRILPALLVVLFFSIVVGWAVLFSWELERLGRHVAASSVFATNFILWSEASYFDSWLKPLLHLWSLGVEEQFYLLWPIAAVGMWKLKIRFTWPLIVVVILSFAWSLFLLNTRNGTTAFYFPFSRFWEIGLGALLATHRSRTDEKQESSALREIVAVAGIASLALTFVFVNKRTLWPGALALLPVGGTAALIWTGPATRINRLLSNKVLVAIGLISYPLYLWHWPLIVFVRLLHASQIPRLGRVGLIPVSIALAFLTYRYIERPIRFGAHKRRSAVLLACGLAVTGLIGVALATSMVKPRLDSSLAAAADAALRDWIYPTSGFRGADGKLLVNTIAGDPSRTILVIGDSHIEQYWPRFVELHRLHPDGPRVVFMTHGGCPILPGTNRTDLTWERSRFRCPEYIAEAFDAGRAANIRTVVIGGYWEAYLNTPDVTLAGTSRTLRKGGPETESVFRLLEDNIRMLQRNGKRVVLVGSNPSAPWFRPDSILPHRRLPWLEPPSRVLAVPRRAIEERNAFARARLVQIARETGAEFIDPVEYMCNAKDCPVRGADDQPIYRDDNHIRATFARTHITFLDQIVSR